MHVYTSERVAGEDYNPYEPRYMPWKDVAVRLSYIHFIDNLIHVIWIRYNFTHGPYTSYLNNSEFTLLLLFIGLALYTYVRIQSHVAFSCNGEPG